MEVHGLIVKLLWVAKYHKLSVVFWLGYEYYRLVVEF